MALYPHTPIQETEKPKTASDTNIPFVPMSTSQTFIVVSLVSPNLVFTLDKKFHAIWTQVLHVNTRTRLEDFAWIMKSAFTVNVSDKKKTQNLLTKAKTLTNFDNAWVTN